MHPILFKIGAFELYSYGALLALAFLVAIFYATKAAAQEGIKPDFISDLGIIVILSSILGSRLFFIVFYNLEYTLEHPEELLRFRQRGLVFYGGLIFAVVASLIYCKRKNMSIPVALDIAAPAIAIGQAIGRIGCLMSGCCFGKPTWVPWAIELNHIGHPRHPTQIYESLATLGIFFVLLWFRKRRTGVGQVAWLYLVMYSIVRFVIEFFRGDNPIVLFGLTLSQSISLLALVMALPLGYLLWFSPALSPSSVKADEGSKG